MIRSIPTVYSYLSQHQTDYVQISAITAVFTHHSSPQETISHDYGSAALSAARGGISRPVLRRSTPTAAEAASTVELDSAASTVRKFYDGINRRDLASVEDLIALNCVYEDLIFSQPFTGRKVTEISEFIHFRELLASAT